MLQRCVALKIVVANRLVKHNLESLVCGSLTDEILFTPLSFYFSSGSQDDLIETTIFIAIVRWPRRVTHAN